MFVYYFVDPESRVEIIFRKERTTEHGGIDFEIVDRKTPLHTDISPLADTFFGSPWGSKHNMDFQ